LSPGDLRRTILTLAGHGKLVAQDAREESGSKLLEKVAVKREQLLTSGYPNLDEAKSQLRKQREQRLPDGLEDLPPGWAWSTLMQTSLLIADCHNKTAPYVSSGIWLIRTTNIRNGQLNLREPKYISEATYERWSARCKPEPGDILITREAPMGEVCIIPHGVKLCMGQRMMLIRLVPDTMNANFLLYSLMDPDLMYRVQDKPIGATVQHLRVGGVETLLVPVPPLVEQSRIVAKVDELMALVDHLEATQTESRKISAKLAEAFVAKLTSQEPAVIRPVFDTKAYLIQLIPAMLREVQRPLALEEINSVIAMLFLPEQLSPMLEITGGRAALSHFASFAQPDEAGSVDRAVQTLIRTRTLHCPEPGETVIFHLNPDKIPPIDPVIAKDAEYLAQIINLIPAEEIEEKARKPIPKPVAKPARHAALNV
ncbi:MAG: restriction endonuclease subunit S, partial [Prosthecobacter sp.]|nr:restriction endonuclease subunit S [Prosthecobacter sp.]